MPNFVSSGIYTREIDLSLYVPTLSSTIFGIVGEFEKGSDEKITDVTSVVDLILNFGNPNPDYLAIYAGMQYLRHGNQLRVIRATGPGATKASVAVGGAATSGSVTGTNLGTFTITAPVSGTHTGTEAGPYNVTGASNDALSIKVDGGGSQVVTLIAGVGRTAQQIVNDINGATVGLTATVTTVGVLEYITITSNFLGATSSIEIETVANDAYTLLGLTVATYSGADGTDSLSIKINGGGSQVIALTAGASQSSADIAGDINATLAGALAGVDNNKIKITSGTTGVASSVEVEAASTADTVLGLDNAIHTGVAAGGTSFTVNAFSKGDWINNYKVIVSDGSIADTFKLTVQDTNSVDIEVWDYLNVTPTSDKFIEKQITTSKYITIDTTGGSGLLPNNGSNTLIGGVDDPAGDADFVAGLQPFINSDKVDCNLLAVPGIYTHQVVTEILSVCEQRGDCLGVVDPPDGYDVQDVIDWHNGFKAPNTSSIAYDSSYGTLFWPWLKIFDYINRQDIWTPPSGFIAAACAFTDQNFELWFAPVGPTRGRLVSVLELEFDANQGDRDNLYGNGNAVNPIVALPRHGVTLYGQRTLQRAPTALDRINVRRMMLYLRKVIATATYYLLFEPNDAVTWRRFSNLVEPFMEGVKQRRGLISYEVICDATTNTPDVIDRNEMNATIFIKPTKAAEKIIISFVVTATGASFEEIVI